jgi:hypothetical protein
VPQTLSAECKVKVSCQDASGSISFDISDNNFSIADLTPPLVVLTSPNGGEIFNFGDEVPIVFTCDDNIGCVQAKFDFSTDSGTTWQLIRDWGNLEPPTWTPPQPGNHYRISVAIRDDAQNEAIDISHDDFTVQDNSSPTVTIISPNGSEVWEGGSIQNITWTAEDNVGIASYKLDYSTDSGSNWIPVQGWTSGNPGAYAWTIPNQASISCRVKITCRDEALNLASDYSDNDFVIDFISPQCIYVAGDINNNGVANGLDVVYGVSYFKGGTPPPYSCDCQPHGTFFVGGDINGSCAFNGLDITFFVAYLKGGGILTPCPDCPPAFLKYPGAIKSSF